MPDNFAPVPDETTIVGLDVDGPLPVALDGTYLRHGPNPIGRPSPDHDGDGMVHAITIRAGRAVGYRNRWVRTAAAAGKLGVEPAPGPPPLPHDHSNHSLVGYAGTILSLGHGSLPYELTSDLDTIARTDPCLAHRGGIAAHAKIDPSSGALVTCPVTAPGTGRSLVHDFGVTRRHFVIPTGTRVAVVDRSDASVQWFEVGATVDHIANAYDTTRGLVADVIGGEGLERWVITNAVDRHVLDATPQRHCRINDSFLARPYRFAYAVGVDRDGRTPSSELFKHDLATGSRELHDFGPGNRPSEFVFVADPARSRAEDGGWLIGFTHHDATGDARLVVLDAEHVGRRALATVHIPRRVPFGTHAAWISHR